MSLSPYFHAIRLSAGPMSARIQPEDLRNSVCMPVRTFRADCLLTASGASLLGALARQSSVVVVQDADMRPEDLKAHCEMTRLEDLMVLDTTRAAGLRGHFSYLIASRADPIMRHIGGERIW